MMHKLCILVIVAFGLAACETTSAALDGMGGVFMGASDDVRAIGGR